MTSEYTEKTYSDFPKRKLRRMSGDLIIGLMGIMIVTAGLGMGMNYILANQKADQALQQEADRYLSYLTRSLELPVWTMDDEAVRQIGDVYFMTSDVFALLEIVSYEHEHQYVYSKRKRDDEMVLRDGQLRREEKSIGKIRIGLTKAPYKRELSRQLVSSLWVVLAMVLAMVATTSLMLRQLVRRPLRILMDTAEDMARGDYDSRREKIKYYEFAMVHDQLVDMARRVKEREASLEEANTKLRRLRNYLSNIIDSMPSVIVAVDLDGRVTQWNKHTETLIGLSYDQARSQLLTQVFPRLAGEMERIETAIRQRRIISSPKVPIKTKQDTRFETITIFPLTANGVEGAVIRMDDVTEQVRLEEMMIQSEKMLTVGGLAAGMAHEINNPLAGMMQTADVMAGRLGAKLDIPANRKAAQEAGTTVAAVAKFMELRGIPRMLATIIDSGKRVAEIVENMLSFARKSEAAVSTHDLGKLLDKTLELAVTDYDLKKKYDFKRIVIEKEYGDPPVCAPCEGTKIQQVLLNILRNGAEAMGDTPSPRFIFRTRQEGDTAVMEIEDNGPGMDEQTRKRIFEPFFTTKPVGVGTGLGLSVSYFIITENHGGEMVVESRPDAGAKFIIRLPLTSE